MFAPAAPLLVPSPRRACVVDARLAFGNHGVLTVTRLLGELEVWLPSEVRGVVSGARRLLGGAPVSADDLLPRLFCPETRRVDRAADAAAAKDELRLWDRLPEDPELASLPLHHLGDRLDECVVPPQADRGILDRFVLLRAALELCADDSRYDQPGLLTACFIDAAALCAVLAPRRAFLLTRLESDARGDPAICEYLEAWGVSASRAPDGGGVAAARLGATLADAGLSPLVWAGVTLAAVHIVMEGIPVLGASPSQLSPQDVAPRWRRAKAFWHLV